MIDCFEALDEGLFGLRDVAEGDGAIIESTIRHLPINDTIDQLGDGLFGVLLQTA